MLDKVTIRNIYGNMLMNLRSTLENSGETVTRNNIKTVAHVVVSSMKTEDGKPLTKAEKSTVATFSRAVARKFPSNLLVNEIFNELYKDRPEINKVLGSDCKISDVVTHLYLNVPTKDATAINFIDDKNLKYLDFSNEKLTSKEVQAIRQILDARSKKISTKLRKLDKDLISSRHNAPEWKIYATSADQESYNLGVCKHLIASLDGHGYLEKE